MTDLAPPSTAPASTSPGEDILETLRIVGAGLLIAVALRIVVFQPFTIPSSSMEPGLVTGDYIVVSKFAYGWSRASVQFHP